MTKTALISVYDKTGIAEFAKGLASLGYELLSTGGTAKVLRDAGLKVVDVSEYTKSPEMMGGRVKTLHPLVFGGVLFKRGKDDAEAAARGCKNVDLVCVNLYPFEQAAASGASDAQAIEEIDVGGVALLRAAAKNFESVVVVSNVNDYDSVLNALRDGSNGGLQFRRDLAVKAFARTAAYDAAIAKRFGFDGLALVLPKSMDLRYGENPHQKAALYGFNNAFEKLNGKELSFNNLVDVDAAIAMAREFNAGKAGEASGEIVAVVVKHTNPCGAAVAETQEKALAKAIECDPASAFGGVFAFNVPLSVESANVLANRFVEVVVAPGFERGAVEFFAGKKTVLLDATKAFALAPSPSLKSIFCGVLSQTPDNELFKEWRVVSQRAVSEEEKRDLIFAWKFCKHVKSNAIVLARGSQLVGVGCGQTSRVDSVRLAVAKAEMNGLKSAGSVLASDAFFPFRDGVDAAADAGVVALVQPGGSVKDSEVSKAADERGLSMVFTGTRHFKH